MEEDLLDELRKVSQRLGNAPETRNLRDALSSSWSSSSEMLGELGVAIRALEQSDVELGPSTRQVFARVMKVVHETWPKI